MEGEVITKLLGGLRETAGFLTSAFAVFYLHKTIDRLAVCLLNLLAFLFHGIQRLIDDEYRRAYDHASRKIDFFRALPTR
jgi:hypothetical protein